ncbi:GNAT family N-acetyltransferase [Halovivax asiaticus]|nr:GNAT family N-acetyltransferase [Halovivax asiaticus]
MRIRRLRPERAAVERYVEGLWIPYHRDLSETIESHALVEEDGLTEAVTDHTMDLLDSSSTYLWVAVEGADDAFANLTAADWTYCGFLLGVVEPSPSHFDNRDTFVVGDIYVRDAYRGSGLADRLVDRATSQAQEDGCAELALNVDLENERALAFYERRGFEPSNQRMKLSVQER